MPCKHHVCTTSPQRNLPVDLFGREPNTENQQRFTANWTHAPHLPRESINRFWEAEKHTISQGGKYVLSDMAVMSTAHSVYADAWSIFQHFMPVPAADVGSRGLSTTRQTQRRLVNLLNMCKKPCTHLNHAQARVDHERNVIYDDLANFANTAMYNKFDAIVATQV